MRIMGCRRLLLCGSDDNERSRKGEISAKCPIYDTLL